MQCSAWPNIRYPSTVGKLICTDRFTRADSIQTHGFPRKANRIRASKQTFSHTATNGILGTDGNAPDELLSCVVTANLPQLLLSLSYFVYNSLYTRLCTEKEWNSYGIDYRALRVTRPQGQQRSTYRLQLPYRYSVPLIVVSIFLHWLVSNALYVFVLEGGEFPFYPQGGCLAKPVITIYTILILCQDTIGSNPARNLPDEPVSPMMLTSE